MNLSEVLFIEDVIVFVFRIINFAVLLGLLGYGFKRYGLPVLRESYQAYYGYFESLSYYHSRLLNESNDIDQLQEKDRQEQELLKKRMMQWKSAVESKHDLLEQQYQKQRIELDERLKIQQEKIREYRLKAQIMPLAVADARKRLIERAATAKFQHAILQKTKTLLRKVH